MAVKLVKNLNIQYPDVMGNTTNENKSMPDCMVERKSVPSIEYNSGCITETPYKYPDK